MTKLNKLFIILGILLILFVCFLFFYSYHKAIKSDLVLPENDSYLKNLNLTSIALYEICMDNYEGIAAECIAYQTKDPDYCDYRGFDDWGAWCKAKITKDSRYCENLTEFWDYHNCLIDTVTTTSECDAIDFTNEPYEINECYAYATGDVSYCDKLPEKDMLSCKADLGYGGEELCDQNPVFYRKWDCKFKHSTSPTVCEDYLQAYCEFMYLNKTWVKDVPYFEDKGFFSDYDTISP